jgi:DNA-binding NarL/FixJ family response regulator
LIEQAFLAGDTARVAELRDEWRSLESHPEIQRYCRLAGLPVDEPMEPARGSYEQALELAASGEAEPMMEALRVLDELGARPAAELVRRRLRKLGMRVVRRGPSAATRAHPEGLTSRQADVLQLVVDGLTNAEIAEKLVLSVRTVDHHVSAILTRLGVSSRREVRAAARSRSAVA